MSAIKQSKGTDNSKLSVVRTPTDNEEFYISTKYDGRYTQLHFINNKLTCYTSGHIKFMHPELEKYLVGLDLETPFITLI